MAKVINIDQSHWGLYFPTTEGAKVWEVNREDGWNATLSFYEECGDWGVIIEIGEWEGGDSYYRECWYETRRAAIRQYKRQRRRLMRMWMEE